ncbi:hypothetical protein [Bacteroides sp. ET336]|nr:hypothetical protein [Bacteroides sp. ET336]MCR8894202.1 hypothetical protein [Bacteroides sp. ET336]MDN0058699.1 hypothetical protein [Bacteroides caecigallinarum]
MLYELLGEEKLGKYEIAKLKSIRKRFDRLLMEIERRLGMK